MNESTQGTKREKPTKSLANIRKQEKKKKAAKKGSTGMYRSSNHTKKERNKRLPTAATV